MWMVKIGRVNITNEVSMISSHMAMPSEVHLEAVLHVFAFLCQNYNSTMAFESNSATINKSYSKDCKWKDFYGE